MRRRWIRALQWAAAILIGLPLLYVTIALALSVMVRSRPLPDRGIAIYACDNGVHADLVLPVTAGGIDWRATFAPEAFTGAVDALGHIGFGWGGRDFYLNTPTWADVKPGIAIKSVLWDETVLRVDYRPAPSRGEDCREWRVDDAAYLRIAAHIQATLRLSQVRPVQAGPGYGDHDAFYIANGRYTITETCNQWTGRALRLGGAPVAPWTPFSFLVLWNLPTIPM